MADSPVAGPATWLPLRTRSVDGPDPLAPPVDLRAALDKIGQDVMEGSSLRQALRELLRQGTEDRRGLDELARQLWQRRRDLQRNNRMDGTLQEVRELLDKALDAREGSAGPCRIPTTRGSTSSTWRPCRTTPAAPSARCGKYDWQSAEARQAYQQIQDLLGRECWTSGSPG